MERPNAHELTDYLQLLDNTELAFLEHCGQCEDHNLLSLPLMGWLRNVIANEQRRREGTAVVQASLHWSALDDSDTLGALLVTGKMLQQVDDRALPGAALWLSNLNRDGLIWMADRSLEQTQRILELTEQLNDG